MGFPYSYNFSSGLWSYFRKYPLSASGKYVTREDLFAWKGNYDNMMGQEEKKSKTKWINLKN